MGEKREEKLSENPAPGQYDTEAATNLKSSKVQVAVIGTERRKNMLEGQNQDQPGPGTYTGKMYDFGKDSKGFTISKASRDEDWEYVTEE